MRVTFKGIAGLGTIALLAGCASGGGNSGGGSNSGSSTILGAVPDVSEYQSTLTTLTAATPSDLSSLTKQSDLPTSGQANYFGVANLTLSGDVSTFYLGGADVVFDFSKKAMTGDITNFQSRPSTSTTLTPVTGSLDFSGGKLTGNNESGVGSGITGSASGTVDGQSLDFDVSGGFFGSDGENVSLNLTDTGTSSGGFVYLSQ